MRVLLGGLAGIVLFFGFAAGAVLGLAELSHVLHMNDEGDPSWLVMLRALGMIFATLAVLGVGFIVALIVEVLGGFSPGQLRDEEWS